jgi:hypothetical protein
MDAAAAKHYKFINSKTGYVIYYHTLKGDLREDEIKAELEKIKAKVAVDNSLFWDTIYWEEIKDENK